MAVRNWSQHAWQSSGTVILAFACLLLQAHSLAAASPMPTDRLAFDSNRTGNFEIFLMKADGTAQTQLTNDASYDSFWPKPSPDRRRILFMRTPAGVHDTDYTTATTWIMNADGSGLKQILPPGAHGWSIQGHPEWKPDGSKIAMIGGPSHNSQIFVINPDGSQPIRLTSNGRGKMRGGTNTDPSWAPDGKSLLFVGCPSFFCLASSYEIYRINADGTGETRLTDDNIADYDPYYSPSGAQIAWLRHIGGPRWAIYRMRPDGSGTRPVIDDGGVNSKPAWGHSSSVIYFHRIPPNASRGLFNVWRIDSDGKNLTEIITPRPVYINEYPVAGIQ